MCFELSIAGPRPSPSSITSSPTLHFRGSHRFGFPVRCSQEPKLRFKLLGQSLGDGWKLKDIDGSAVQERLNLWLLKTQNFLNEVASPLVKTGQVRKTDPENSLDTQEIGELILAERTIDCRTPNGSLSLAAIASIEQFSRMNGLSGKKMQRIFEALTPESVCNDVRNLVEYCCFRFLSRDSSDIHPCLKEPAFQRLIFITMLAWEHPYSEDTDSSGSGLKSASLQGKLVGEAAFVRIAPAVAGVADRSTAHNIFKGLAGDDQGISLSSWTTYIGELLKVHEGRMSYQARESLQLSSEQILCIGSSKKRPVLKWENNMAWPGKLTLTDKALYFEAVGLRGQRGAIRMDLSRHGSRVEKARVGPLGYALFDSALSVSSGPESETWVLEFVDFRGDMRRDVWHAFISEIIALYEFIREYGPEHGDQSIHHVYGAHKGNRKATVSTINSIARLQALQFIHKLSEDPAKLVQFSYLRSAPYGHIVCQTLAVNFWGGPLVTKFTEAGNLTTQGIRPSDEVPGSSIHVFDIDGSVYLRKWMKSPSWTSNGSVTFWKNSSVRQGVVLSKDLVVADMTLVERASATSREKSQVVEKTQATIDAAMIQGIPSNIDLFKEVMFPLSVTVNNFEKLRRWEEPHVTVAFLSFAYAIIFRNLLPYIFPMTLIAIAAAMLLLKLLKEQGRLGRSFGKVMICDQPPSNTIQKIIALKEAMRVLEKYLQNLNVTLLKIRTIVLSGQPQITTEVAIVLLSSAAVLLTVPFRYILAFFLLDVFTRELEFRREMVMRFMSFLKERWDTVPAAPVVVLPFESDKNGPMNSGETIDDQGKPEQIQSSGMSR